jgi:hypothetical protein
MHRDRIVRRPSHPGPGLQPDSGEEAVGRVIRRAQCWVPAARPRRRRTGCSRRGCRPASGTNWHLALVRHGSTVCLARRPRCEECVLIDLCPYGQAGPAAVNPASSSVSGSLSVSRGRRARRAAGENTPGLSRRGRAEAAAEPRLGHHVMPVACAPQVPGPSALFLSRIVSAILRLRGFRGLRGVPHLRAVPRAARWAARPVTPPG